jgi:hypothetical protein
MAAEERELLISLDVTIGAVLREVPHLRASTRGNNSKRHSAKYLLH